MGMMTRRNAKARAVKSALAFKEKKVVEPLKEEVKEVVEETTEATNDLAEKVKAKGLSKTDINKMTTADLQELAKSFDIADAEEMSGSQIKRVLCGALED